ncbi:MAG: ParB/RepB/Spo0J family partition protein [Paracoccaceae bacterium]
MTRRSQSASQVENIDIAPQTRLIPLDQLYLHPINPRKEPPEAEIEALAASISAVGLLQNLSGFADSDPANDNPDHPGDIGIVAGGRRLRALQMLAARGDWTSPVPVNITTDTDMAIQWAGAENESHAQLPIVDRIGAYAQMRERGHTIETIATTFSAPIGSVRQLLALATLPTPAITALRNGDITLDIAKALTTARDADVQTMALEAALRGKDAWAVKAMLRRDTVSSKDKRARYVGLQAYHEAGGSSTTDLFSDEHILHDVAILDHLATEKAEAETEEIRAAEGWLWAEYVPENFWQISEKHRRIGADRIPLPEGDAERMSDLTDADELTDAEEAELSALKSRAAQRAFTDQDRAISGILTEIQNGALQVTRAFRRKADELRDTTGDGIEINAAPAEASMPQNLKDDLRRIRLIVIQDALRHDETLTHDLLALQLARKLKPWEQPFALDQTHATPPEKRDGSTIPAELADPCTADQTDPPHITLKAWLNVNEDAIDRAFYNGLARAFCRTDGAIVDHIAARAIILNRPINARTLWTPTLTGFLNRVSASYLDALWRELVPDEGSRHAGFASLSKKDKAKELDQLFNFHATREAMGLTREENARIDAWLPEELRFGAASEEGDA